MAERGVVITIKVPKISPWIILCLILSVALVYVYFFGQGRTGMVISSSHASEKAMSYINDNLVRPGTKASLISVEDVGDFYKVLTSYMGNQIPVYVTKDGRYLLFNLVDLSKPVEKPNRQEFDAPDKPVPEVQLFVMAFCPFGNQAEEAMKPVVDLLADKIDFKLRFIVSVLDSDDGRSYEVKSDGKSYYVSSLHGPGEALEDLVEACVQKVYDSKTLMEFVTKVNGDCADNYRDLSEMDKCWKRVANSMRLDTKRIESCAKGKEGLNLLREDESVADSYGVTGSPTLIINDEKYYGARTSESFKNGICSGFDQKPEECSQKLSSSGSETSGGC